MRWISAGVVATVIALGGGAQAQSISRPDIGGIMRGWEINQSCHARTSDFNKVDECSQSAFDLLDDDSVILGLRFGMWLDLVRQQDKLYKIINDKSQISSDIESAKHEYRGVLFQAVTVSGYFFKRTDRNFIPISAYVNLFRLDRDEIANHEKFWRGLVQRIDEQQSAPHPTK